MIPSRSRSVELQISNNTLKEPRTYFGRSSSAPLEELSPGSSDTCRFWCDFLFWDLSGTLVNEAESFSLAIYCYNPINNQSSKELGLELSPGKAHVDDLVTAYHGMAKGICSSSDQDMEFTRVTGAGSLGTARLSHGPIKVMATMSNDTSSRIKVVLEEEEESGEEAETEKPRDVKRDRSKRSEILQDLLWNITDSPGSA